MKNYKYRCVEQSGKETAGEVAAETINEARSLLKARGLKIVSISEGLARKGSVGNKHLFKKKKIKDIDIYNMAKEMGVLLKAGLRIDKCLEIIGGSARNEAIASHLMAVLKDVRAGVSVAEAFNKTGMFNPLMVSILRVGESVGDLNMSFVHIARHVQFQLQFKSEIRNALTYPIFLVFASMITLLVIFQFIVPRFFSVFGGERQQYMPFISKLLFKMAAYTNMYTIFGAIIVILLFIKIVNVKHIFLRLYSSSLSFPIVGTIVLNLELSRFSYSMYTMLSSGIEFIRSLRLSTELVQNKRIKNALEPAITYIREGRGIAQVMAEISVLPDIAVNMISVGEQSGNMKEIFLELFQVFDDNFKGAVKKIVVLIEPAIITVMGGIVGFIVISLILTVMSVGNIKF
ncbi:MAG: type II secretion system F family protein [Candidatus Magnetoovum sp. WYHC-5]|nr:type II secretion system F family protein [Candidatus Magnetoovum sp. WYHC-5]